MRKAVQLNSGLPYLTSRLFQVRVQLSTNRTYFGFGFIQVLNAYWP